MMALKEPSNRPAKMGAPYNCRAVQSLLDTFLIQVAKRLFSQICCFIDKKKIYEHIFDTTVWYILTKRCQLSETFLQGETADSIRKNSERRLSTVAYEFYLKNGREDASLIGILPERRKNGRRVTRKSILKWGKLAAGSYVDPGRIYYIQVGLQDEGRIITPIYRLKNSSH